jgi:hypothetical protein
MRRSTTSKVKGPLSGLPTITLGFQIGSNVYTAERSSEKGILSWLLEANQPQVAVTVNSRVIKTFFAWAPEATDVPLMNGLRIQILPSMEDLSQARKYQFAAFIASESLLIVWDDDPSNVITRATKIESQLMQLVWQTGEPSGEGEITIEKSGAADGVFDSEVGETMLEHRSTNLMNTVLVACTLVIVVVLLGLACRSLATEIAVDGSYIRLAFLSLVPVQVFFTLVSFLTKLRFQDQD